jgi:hypothetical protein
MDVDTSVLYTLSAYSPSFPPVVLYLCMVEPDIDIEITVRLTMLYTKSQLEEAQ